MKKMEKKDFIVVLKINILIGVIILILLGIDVSKTGGLEDILTLKGLFGVFIMIVVAPIPISLTAGIVFWEYKDIWKESIKSKIFIGLLILSAILRVLYQMKLHK